MHKSGDVIGGRFVLEEPAIHGGMGIVWPAYDKDTRGRVAIKFVAEPRDGSTPKESLLRRFRGEIEILSRHLRNHPHIVRYVDHGRIDNEPWLATEWLEGRGLDKVLENGPLRIEDTLKLGHRVAQALGAAHAADVVHRDIKPSNIHLVGSDVERVKVIDFGIALLAGGHMTSTGVVIGTVGYMAPEQIDYGGNVDATADIFCLGAVLFECLTGRRAFEGGPQHVVLAKIVMAEVPRVAEIRPEVPFALSELIARMLSKDPSQRPQNGTTVANTLEGIAKKASTRPPLPERRTNPVITTYPPASPSDPWARRFTPIPPAPPVPASERMSPLEKQLHFVVAAKPVPDVDDLLADKPPRGLPPEVVAAIRAEVDPKKNEQLHELPGVALLIKIQGRGNPAEIARRAARLALEIAGLAKGSRVAIFAAYAEANDKAPVGKMLDGVFHLLDMPTLDGGKGPRPVRVNDVACAFLDARFDVTSYLGEFWLRSERETTRAVRTLLGKKSPYIGRDQELDTVCKYVEQALQGRRPRAVLVLGEPGAGKSRLRFELVERLSLEKPNLSVVLGRGDPLRAGSAFSIVGSALRSAAGISAGEPPDASQEKLRALVGTYLAGSDKRRVTEFLGEVVGLHFPDEGRTELRAARSDAALMADHIKEAFFDFVRALTDKTPFLLVLEELEWSDAASLKLVDAALDALRDRDFAVLALSRPDVRERLPGLWEGREVQDVRLHPLHKDDAARIVRSALGPQTPRAVVDRIVELGAGNAFYLEELIRAVNEGRGGALPESVLGMVDARIDSKSLDDEARRVLRAASIFGEAAWEGALGPIVFGHNEPTGSLGKTLDKLCNCELLTRRRQSRFAGETEYAFRHPLLREAAYARLTDDDLQLGHKRAAEWLLAAGESDKSVLALHFERAGDGPRAVEFYVHAAEQALSGGALEAAIDLAKRGLALGADGEAAAELWAIATDAQSWRSSHARAYEAARCAFLFARPGSRHHARALGGAIRSALAQGDAQGTAELFHKLLDERPAPDAVLALSWAFSATIDALLDHEPAAALPYLERMRLVTAAAAEREPVVAAWMLHTHAHWTRAVEQDPGAALGLDRESVLRFKTIGDRRYLPYARIHVGLDLLLLGAHEQADKALREGLDQEPEGSLTSIVGSTFEALRSLERGAFVPARAMAEDVAAQAESRGERLAARRALLLAARASIALGELDKADRMLGALRAASTPPGALYGVRAAFFLASKKPDKTLTLLDRALALRPSRGAHPAPAPPELTLLRVEALLLLGAHHEARATLAAARADIHKRAATLLDDELRSSFLKGRAANARLLQLCKEWLADEPGDDPNRRLIILPTP
ncbi:serine/threonine-protein kinase [Polyangium mundeleinium]|uniref:Protein kinase n=1 Tax=Polyangium mundeleinium TaxID=2995306 RepID=A0ABT5ES50_9BACT|nr:serine/threonine-protein kinase [Polyangium mundeleinium]MDC0743561.1 protein kinase [Polyangium mundeleinium]